MTYLQAGSQGEHSKKTYVKSVLQILFVWMIIGGIATLAFDAVAKKFMAASMATYLSTNIGFVFFAWAIYRANKKNHKRAFKTLITPRASINYKTITLGFAVYMGLMAVSTFIEYLIEPSAVSFHGSLMASLKFLPIALIVTFIQTTTEELFFRGYVLQGLSQKFKGPVVLSVVSGIIFTLPHLANPEVAKSLLFVPPLYFIMGFLLAIITLKSNSLELAIGAHAANNFFGVFMINFKESALAGTDSILITSRFNVYSSLVLTLGLAFAYYFIVIKVLKVGKENK